jgi:hypothetical protein
MDLYGDWVEQQGADTVAIVFEVNRPEADERTWAGVCTWLSVHFHHIVHSAIEGIGENTTHPDGHDVLRLRGGGPKVVVLSCCCGSERLLWLGLVRPFRLQWVLTD